MPKIHRLPPSIIMKIAAGEVIERPAFAVKELIENAIDAQATFIDIQVDESGLRRITVTDDGIGMTNDDLEICFLPHTTSKLKPDDDLTGIRSLGFRGEALSAIAAVSHMTIITRTPKDIGGRIIQIRGGIVEDSAPIGAPIGTSVTAEGLFYSVPARKKFLKSAQTEFRHITEIVTHFALIYPHIRFHLKHNKKSVFDLPKVSELPPRIRTILGSSFAENIIPFSHEEGAIRISGFLGKPQIAAKLNQKQYIFVNNRSITDRLIQLAIKEAYGSLLPTTATPVFVLSLSLPHETVDVNVHPRKEKVTFVSPDLIFNTIKLAVTKTLQEHNITFQLAKFKQENSAKLGETTSPAASILKEIVLPWQRTDPITISPHETVTQLHQTYLITSDSSHIYFIDQHAAHERILFETFRQQFSDAKKITLQMKEPVEISVSLVEKQLLEEYRDLFKNAGISYTVSGENTAVLTSIPSVFSGRKIERIVKDMLSDLAAEIGSRSEDAVSLRMLKFLACRAAVQAGDVLTEKQQHDVIRQLNNCREKETCPHGRPTTIALTLRELHREFQR